MWLARTRLLRHAFPISLMILRKKTRLFCSLMSFKTYFYLFYCFLPSVATWDGKYEHGLKLFQVLMLSLQKSSQNLLWFVLLGEICLISSFLKLYRGILCMVKARGGTWVFFGWVCAARDSKLAPRFLKKFP